MAEQLVLFNALREMRLEETVSRAVWTVAHRGGFRVRFTGKYDGFISTRRRTGCARFIETDLHLTQRCAGRCCYT